MPQFKKVDAKFGAPAGRKEFGELSEIRLRSLYVFIVRLDSHGYDDGGAYWGRGIRLYCVRDSRNEFCRFVRANSRDEAIKILGISVEFLKRTVRGRGETTNDA